MHFNYKNAINNYKIAINYQLKVSTHLVFVLNLNLIFL